MSSRMYPPQKPCEPTKPLRSSYALIKAGKGKLIYRDVEVNGDSEFDLDEYFEDQDEKRPEIPEKRYWQNLSLQDIVDLAPPGTKLCDIILSISMPRYLEYTDVAFTAYSRNLEAEEAAYQKDLAKYEKAMIKYEKEKDLVKYEKEKAIYDQWLKDQEIEKLEAQLKKLKK
jgi:hypothetical protein